MNLLATPGEVSHLDYLWSEISYRKFLKGIGSFAKVAVFDKIIASGPTQGSRAS